MEFQLDTIRAIQFVPPIGIPTQGHKGDQICVPKEFQHKTIRAIQYLETIPAKNKKKKKKKNSNTWPQGRQISRPCFIIFLNTATPPLLSTPSAYLNLKDIWYCCYPLFIFSPTPSFSQGLLHAINSKCLWKVNCESSSGRSNQPSFCWSFAKFKAKYTFNKLSFFSGRNDDCHTIDKWSAEGDLFVFNHACPLTDPDSPVFEDH